MALLTAPKGHSKILIPVRGINDQIVEFREQIIDQRADPALDYDPFAYLSENRRFRMSLMESWVSQPDAANLLRDGIRFIAFNTYAGIPTTYEALVRSETSGRPEEEYIRDADMGTIPKAPSGQPVTFAKSGFEGAVKISNALYRVAVMITGDDIKFDRLGKIRQIAASMGRAARMTEESEFYAAITTTANFTRNSTTNDNDQGANYQSLTFGPVTLDTAMAVIGTAKDRKSGNYLGYKADTIIAGPLMETAIKQMLMSTDLQRTGAQAANEGRGYGTYNAYRGLLNRIVISPWFGASYGWALCDSTAYSYVWQWVDRWQVMQEGMSENSEAWLMNNALRYVISGYFGHGFVDDRAWFLSTSTSAPAGA